jgi:hypothetical protein
MSRFPTPAHLVSWVARPAGPPVRPAQGQGQPQERQPLHRRGHRRDLRRGRPHPDPRRSTLPAAGPPGRQGQSPGCRRRHPAEGLPRALVQPRHSLPRPRRRLLRQTRPGQAQGQVPPRRARCPRLRCHPHPEDRPGRRRGRQADHGCLTRPPTHPPPSRRRRIDRRRQLLPPAQLSTIFRVSPPAKQIRPSVQRRRAGGPERRTADGRRNEVGAGVLRRFELALKGRPLASQRWSRMTPISGKFGNSTLVGQGTMADR